MPLPSFDEDRELRHVALELSRLIDNRTKQQSIAEIQATLKGAAEYGGVFRPLAEGLIEVLDTVKDWIDGTTPYDPPREILIALTRGMTGR